MEQVKAAANRWLADGVFVLEVHPLPDYQAAMSELLREFQGALQDRPITTVARKLIHPGCLLRVVVGDRSKIEAPCAKPISARSA